ncbi:2379_t:CDS:2 [Paraglomus occultum]|uniref:2379_t:CDS:1 n=1 Tax=Paraglomus occultum TaxID=144539 RepID=A0A9N8YYP3_9GLOM|nr:2379_t:CDS:2 [Paraglomus occultum]
MSGTDNGKIVITQNLKLLATTALAAAPAKKGPSVSVEWGDEVVAMQGVVDPDEIVEDAPSTISASINEFVLSMVVAGLAATTPYMMNATIASLSRLIFEFKESTPSSAYEDALYGSESDLEDSADEIEELASRKPTKSKKDKSSPQIWIKEEEDMPVDFLDRSVVSRIMGTNLRSIRKNHQHLKRRVTAGNKIKFKTRKNDMDFDDVEPIDAIAVRNAKKKEKKIVVGKEYRAKRAAGDVKKKGKPDPVQCPHCKQFVTTDVRYRNGVCTYLLASGLLVTTVVLFWVPFYLKATKDVRHVCPHCFNNLGVKHRLG